MENETLKVIKRRRSTRNFREEQIKEEDLHAIVEAGQFAPNGGGEQPWHFTVVQNKAVLEEMTLASKDFAVTTGMEWLAALGRDPGFHPIYHAPTLVIVSCPETDLAAEADAAAAMENILIAAESLEIGACWVYFVLQAFSSVQGEAFRKRLEIPAGYHPFHAAALGYKAGPAGEAPARKADCVTYVR